MNFKDTYKYVIFKSDVFDTNFLIFDISELPKLGFHSLYQFTAETTETFETAGFKGYKGTVWSPTLAIDADSDEVAAGIEQRLTSLGLEFEVWATGNRGLHFYVTRPHTPSHVLPNLDKAWVEANFPEADLSIYHNVAMFRIKGARHSKTGKPKVFLRKVEGEPLYLSDKIEIITKSPDLGSEVDKSIFINGYIMTQTIPQFEGKRHEALLKLGMAMKRMGEPIEFISRWLYHTNLLFAEPKPLTELQRIVTFVETADVIREYE